MALPKKNKNNNTSAYNVPTEEDFINVDPFDDDEDDDDGLIEEYERLVEKHERKTGKDKPKFEGTETSPFYDEEDTMEEDIDYEKEKILPFGDKRRKKAKKGKGKKTKIKDSDLDNRDNLIKKHKMTQLIVWIIIIAMFGLAIKNTLFPSRNYTREQVQQIARNAVGDNGFPIEIGKAYAKEFLMNYLIQNNDKEHQQLMARFYTGDSSNTTTEMKGRTYPRNGSQYPIHEPICFSAEAISPETAIYKFSVYLSNSDGKTLDKEGNLTGHWLSFAVTVYYDKQQGSVSIIESPTLVPTYTIAQPKVPPKAKPLGTGDEDEEVAKAAKPTIEGFIKAWANSSELTHFDIDQYIVTSKPVELTSGMAGDVKLAENDPITYQVYKTDKENEWKVDVQVRWQNAQVTPEEDAVIYDSHYVMTIEKTSQGVYLVNKFAPYLFVPAENSNNSKVNG